MTRAIPFAVRPSAQTHQRPSDVPQPARLCGLAVCLPIPATRAAPNREGGCREEGPPFLLASVTPTRVHSHHATHPTPASPHHPPARAQTSTSTFVRANLYKPTSPGRKTPDFSSPATATTYAALTRHHNHLCARATRPPPVNTEGQHHVPAPDGLRPRPHQTHPSGKGRHASRLVRP